MYRDGDENSNAIAINGEQLQQRVAVLTAPPPQEARQDGRHQPGVDVQSTPQDNHLMKMKFP